MSQKNKDPQTSVELSDDGDGLDGWMEVCIRCNKPGEMTCCDRCPRAYHSHCLEKDEINENNEWKCPGCFMDDDMLVKVEQKGAFDMCKEFLERLLSHDLFSLYFLEPVEKNLRGAFLRKYKKIIERPMDLSTVRRRVYQDGYSSQTQKAVVDFCRDVWQIGTNCCVFNEEGSALHRVGTLLSTKFKEFIVKKIVLEVNEQTVEKLANIEAVVLSPIPKTHPPDSKKRNNANAPSRSLLHSDDEESPKSDDEPHSFHSSHRITQDSKISHADVAPRSLKTLLAQSSQNCPGRKLIRNSVWNKRKGRHGTSVGKKKVTSFFKQSPVPHARSTSYSKEKDLSSQESSGLDQSAENSSREIVTNTAGSLPPAEVWCFCASDEKCTCQTSKSHVSKDCKQDKAGRGVVSRKLDEVCNRFPRAAARKVLALQLEVKVGDYVKVLYDEDWWFGKVTQVFYLNEDKDSMRIEVKFLLDDKPEEFPFPDDDVLNCEEKEALAVKGKRHAWERSVAELADLLQFNLIVPECSTDGFVDLSAFDCFVGYQFEEKDKGAWWPATITDVQQGEMYCGPVFKVEYPEHPTAIRRTSKKMLEIISFYLRAVGRLEKIFIHTNPAKVSQEPLTPSKMKKGSVKPHYSKILNWSFDNAKLSKQQKWQTDAKKLEQIIPKFDAENPESLIGYKFKEFFMQNGASIWLDAKVVSVYKRQDLLTGPLYCVQYESSKEKHLKRTIKLKETIIKHLRKKNRIDEKMSEENLIVLLQTLADNHYLDSDHSPSSTFEEEEQCLFSSAEQKALPGNTNRFQKVVNKAPPKDKPKQTKKAPPIAEKKVGTPRSGPPLNPQSKKDMLGVCPRRNVAKQPVAQNKEIMTNSSYKTCIDDTLSQPKFPETSQSRKRARKESDNGQGCTETKSDKGQGCEACSTTAMAENQFCAECGRKSKKLANFFLPVNKKKKQSDTLPECERKMPEENAETKLCANTNNQSVMHTSVAPKESTRLCLIEEESTSPVESSLVAESQMTISLPVDEANQTGHLKVKQEVTNDTQVITQSTQNFQYVPVKHETCPDALVVCDKPELVACDGPKRMGMPAHVIEFSSSDDEVQCLDQRAFTGSLMIHARFDCPIFDIADKPNRIQHCDKCYCFVCEIEASSCPAWHEHCHAKRKGVMGREWAIKKKVWQAAAVKK